MAQGQSAPHVPPFLAEILGDAPLTTRERGATHLRWSGGITCVWPVLPGAGLMGQALGACGGRSAC